MVLHLFSQNSKSNERRALKMLKNLIKPALLLGVALTAFLLAARPAQASLMLKLQLDGGTVITITNPSSTGPAAYSGGVSLTGANTTGDYVNVVISIASSNSPGGTNGLEQEASVFVTAVYGSGTSHTLHISSSAQGFTTPNSPPPLFVLDSASGTQNNGTTSGTFQGYADATNALFGTGFAGQKLTFSVNGLSQSWSANGSVGGFSPNGSTYSLSTFETLTMTGGTSLTLTGGDVQTVVPAPAGLALVLTGLPVLGIGGWLRRRVRQA